MGSELRLPETIQLHRLRNYFKKYIPQVCEGYMFIDPLMKPKIRRLSETYMEQLLELDDQLHDTSTTGHICGDAGLHLMHRWQNQQHSSRIKGSIRRGTAQ
ncbi:Acetyl-CoA carboxylase 1 [Manis javanica]|nr:Acetyl-CoA carboxylase 1 [Manis javanica]